MPLNDYQVDTRCPNCKTPVIHYQALHPPKPEEEVLCCNCLSLLRFTDDLQLRMATPEEMGATEDELKVVRTAITTFHRRLRAGMN